MFWTERYFQNRGMRMNDRNNVAQVVQELHQRTCDLEKRIETILFDDMRAKLAFERMWMETPRLDIAKGFFKDNNWEIDNENDVAEAIYSFGKRMRLMERKFMHLTTEREAMKEEVTQHKIRCSELATVHEAECRTFKDEIFKLSKELSDRNNNVGWYNISGTNQSAGWVDLTQESSCVKKSEQERQWEEIRQQTRGQYTSIPTKVEYDGWPVQMDYMLRPGKRSKNDINT